MAGPRDAILDATEELLAAQSLGELSVARILERAGVSRTTFYTHFPSKHAVVAACFRRFMDDVLAAVGPILDGPVDDPEAAVRASLQGWVTTCIQHRGTVRAAGEEWPNDAELRRLWWGRIDHGARTIAATIRADRATGAAPPGADPEALAACLIWAFERVVHVTLVGGTDGLRDPRSAIEPLVQLLVGGVYGRPLASAPAGGATARP